MKKINWNSIHTFTLGMLVGALIVWVIPVIAQEFSPENPPVGLEQAVQLTGIAQDKMHEGAYKDALHALHSAAFVLEEGLGLHEPWNYPIPAPDFPGPVTAPMPFPPDRPMDREGRGAHLSQLGDMRELINMLRDEHGLDVTELTEMADQYDRAVAEGQTREAEDLRIQLHRTIQLVMEENGIQPPIKRECNTEVDFATGMSLNRALAENLAGSGVDLGDIPGRLDEAQRLYDQGSVEDAWSILRAVKQELIALQEQQNQ